MVIIEPVVIIVPEEVIIVPLSALKSILHIYFNKTQLVLFLFYRQKSEKCQIYNSEVAQPLSTGFYQSCSVILDHSWCYKIEKLVPLSHQWRCREQSCTPRVIPVPQFWTGREAVSLILLVEFSQGLLELCSLPLLPQSNAGVMSLKIIPVRSVKVILIHCISQLNLGCKWKKMVRLND